MPLARHRRAREGRGGAGQRRHEPTDVTRGQVEVLAGFGVRHEDIGLVIGIDDKTLRKWYRHELDTGKARANAKMAQTIFQKALGNGPQAATLAIFWAKTQMGWSERSIQEVTGPGGNAVQSVINVRFVDGSRNAEQGTGPQPGPGRPLRILGS